jgi:hypothetical protein
LYKFVQQSLREGDFSIVDALFRAVEVTALPAEALVAMLRYSFAAHRKLPNWARFLESVRSELDRRKMDSQKILSGLAGPNSAQPAAR